MVPLICHELPNRTVVMIAARSALTLFHMSRLVMPDIELPHLLEWYASYCINLAEKCEQPRTARRLRILSVDLALAAERFRRLGSTTEPSERPRDQESSWAAIPILIEPPPNVRTDMRRSPRAARKGWRLPSLIVAVLVFWLFGNLI
jgi:hypothetical protein